MYCLMCDGEVREVFTADLIRCSACGWEIAWRDAHELPVELQEQIVREDDR